MSCNQKWFRRPRRGNATGWPEVGSGRCRVGGENRLRPTILILEDRRLLTTIIPVSSTLDTGLNTLRDAINQANSATTAVEIDFNIPTPATITLTQGQLELSNTAVPISIVGPGAGLLTVSGNDASRVLQIDPNVQASLSGLTISG